MEFQKTNLGELSVNGKGSYGIAASAVQYSDELFTYLRITDINDDGTLNKSGLMSVSDEKAEQYLLKPNDIVFARTGGSTGRSYFYDGTDGEFVYAGFLIKFSIDSTKVNPRFIKYYCLSQEYRGWVHSFNTGSTRGNINAQTYANMPILLPSREQQDLLVDTLSVIDEKIKLNTAINENLEQQAQALFKAWFVDFEPFGGVMPDDWKIISLEKLCDSISKKHKFNKDVLIFLNTGDVENGMILHNNYSEVSQMPGQAKKSIAINDILYSEIRPINKHFAYVNFVADDYVVSTKLMVLRAKGISPRRLYQFLTMPDTLKELQVEAESRSGTFPQIRFDNIQQLEMIVASEQVEKEYSERLNTIYSMIDTNNSENKRLSALRDTLLPKLMNGEIDVSAVKI